MWTCPDCGTLFRRTNQSHSCGTFTVEQMLDGRPESGIELYRALEDGLLRRPNVDVRPVATRILFRVEGVAFASVEKIGKGFVDVSFALPVVAEDAVIKRVFRESADLIGHTARLQSKDDVRGVMALLESARLVQAQD